MTKLSDTQSVILSAAAQRIDRFALPLPKSLKGGAAHKVVNALVDKLGPGRSSLIPILQSVKSHYHGVDADAMQIVADLLDIHPVEVYSVATFYAWAERVMGTVLDLDGGAVIP